MNREIKFRAWDKEKNRMVIWIDDEGYGLYSSPKYEDYGVMGSERFVPMQFTGLHDKNGKEIYEGDIWKANKLSEKLQVIKFDFGKFNIADFIMNNWVFESQRGEVMGTIFDSPELLEAKCD